MDTNIRVGGCYVGPKQGQNGSIREVTDISNGEVSYKDYSRRDGKSVSSGRCEVTTMSRWIAQEATPEECEGLHISAGDLDVKLQAKLKALFKAYDHARTTDTPTLANVLIKLENIEKRLRKLELER